MSGYVLVRLQPSSERGLQSSNFVLACLQPSFEQDLQISGSTFYPQLGTVLHHGELVHMVNE